MRKENKKIDHFPLNIIYTLFLALGFQLITFLVPTEYVYVNKRLILGTFESGSIAIVLLSIAILISIYLLKSTARLQSLVAILLAGLVSNLFDRIFRGGVIDYISIGGFPMFNLPDIVIVIAIILLAISGVNKLKNAV